jgi:hypothetical protein
MLETLEQRRDDIAIEVIEQIDECEHGEPEGRGNRRIFAIRVLMRAGIVATGAADWA